MTRPRGRGAARPLALAAALLAGLLAIPSAEAAPTLDACRAGAERIGFTPELTALRQRMARGEPATIVALGSSSTAGSGATSQDATYPAVLEAELKRRLRHGDIRVVNQGVGGQRAREMVMRLDSDVLPERPALVIWQTGVNDAVNDIGVEKFRKYLRKGVALLQEAGADVVLMDGQWMPRIERYPQYEEYRKAMAEVAAETGASLFRRYDVMKAWSTAGRLTGDEILGVDGLHMVDAGYHCLAVLVADGIERSLAPQVGRR